MNREKLVAQRSQDGVELDLDVLFEHNRPILESDNISGVKVLHVLVQAAGYPEFTWGEAHAAHGLGLAFCYRRGHFEAVYSSNIDLPQRAGELLGCHFASTWTADADEAWNFIKTGLDAGNPVKIAGPEDSVVYAYTDSGDADGRCIQLRGVGGPALTGEVRWEKLSAWVREWVPSGGGGMYRFVERASRPSPEEALRMLARRVVDWQEHHPATRHFGDSANYGISALEMFLSDLLEPEIDIPDDYISCIAINFQHNARLALAEYFEGVAHEVSGPVVRRVWEVALNYRISGEGLSRYASAGLGNERNADAGRQAIKDTVGVALEAERRILDTMSELAND
jgi:hypothetical protein